MERYRVLNHCCFTRRGLSRVSVVGVTGSASCELQLAGRLHCQANKGLAVAKRHTNLIFTLNKCTCVSKLTASRYNSAA